MHTHDPPGATGASSCLAASSQRRRAAALLEVVQRDGLRARAISREGIVKKVPAPLSLADQPLPTRRREVGAAAIAAKAAEKAVERNAWLSAWSS